MYSYSVLEHISHRTRPDQGIAKNKPNQVLRSPGRKWHKTLECVCWAASLCCWWHWWPCWFYRAVPLPSEGTITGCVPVPRFTGLFVEVIWSPTPIAAYCGARWTVPTANRFSCGYFATENVSARHRFRFPRRSWIKANEHHKELYLW